MTAVRLPVLVGRTAGSRLRRVAAAVLLVAWLPAAAQPVSEKLAVRWRPLTDVLEQALQAESLQGSRYSLRIDDLESGQTVFSRFPDRLVNPASVAKLFTTAAALWVLHPEYRFRTELYVRELPTTAKISGPLYVKGYGDPYLIDERLAALAAELKARGIESIEGPLVVDESAFDTEREGPGWEQEDGSHAYLAPTGALSANFNTVRLFLLPGESVGKPAQVSLLPPALSLKLENRLVTHRRTTVVKSESRTVGGETRVTIRGLISVRQAGVEERCRIDRPAEYAGSILLAWLKHQGIKVGNRVRSGQVPQQAELLFSVYSPQLSELVRQVNKISQNFMSEQLFKTLGMELLGEPGSWHKGERAMRAFLWEQVGIPPGSYVIQNGSGLNDVNRVTATQVVKLLETVWRRFDIQADFAASLALAGADGTVMGRLRHPALARRLRLKTGGLHNTRSLAGYVENQAGRKFAFAFIVNDYGCSGAEVSRVLDTVAAAIALSDGDLRLFEEVEIPAGEEVYQEGD